MSLGSFKNDIKNVFTNDTLLIYMYEEDFAFNNLQRLIYHKKNQTKSNQSKF